MLAPGGPIQTVTVCSVKYFSVTSASCRGLKVGTIGLCNPKQQPPLQRTFGFCQHIQFSKKKRFWKIVRSGRNPRMVPLCGPNVWPDNVVLFCYPQSWARRVSAIMTVPCSRSRRRVPDAGLSLVGRRPALGSYWSLLAGCAALLPGPAFFVRILAAAGTLAPGVFWPPDKFGGKMT